MENTQVQAKMHIPCLSFQQKKQKSDRDGEGISALGRETKAKRKERTKLDGNEVRRENWTEKKEKGRSSCV